MPQIVDLDKKSTPSAPKKPGGKPKPPPGPKPTVIIGVSVALVLSLTIAVWYFMSRGGSDSSKIVPYDPPTRNLSGANGGASGNTSTPSVPRGLPGTE